MKKKLDGHIESPKKVDMTCVVTGAKMIGSVLNVKESVSPVFQKPSMRASPAF